MQGDRTSFHMPVVRCHFARYTINTLWHLATSQPYTRTLRCVVVTLRYSCGVHTLNTCRNEAKKKMPLVILLLTAIKQPILPFKVNHARCCARSRSRRNPRAATWFKSRESTIFEMTSHAASPHASFARRPLQSASTCKSSPSPTRIARCTRLAAF